ncbi:serine hydrolase domain-containing protein [Nocardia altamirensis]|uniref:serine hydrolase domain-containing protein n=1 Tax=Nocardia altamirensis TaxID=472158 RepID=UPI000A017160|nr:serine hydrolase domain-containing protein [Nocardia altamirensis]
MLTNHRSSTSKTVRAGIAALLIAGTAAGVTACAPSSAAAPAKPAVQQALDHAVAGGLPGAVAEVHDSTGTWWGRAGLADTGTGRLPERGDQFRVGSITKAFTAAAVLRLVDAGVLNLDDTVAKWLPGVVRGNGNDGNAITVRHLLNQTSGLANPSVDDQEMLNNFSGKDYMQHRFDNLGAEDIVRITMKYPPYYAPGAGWRYSNTNYFLLGMIIEKATGRGYADEIQRLVIDPLSLADTYVAGPEFEVRGPHGRLYSKLWSADPDAPVYDVTDMNPSWAGAAGAIVSTTADLSRFVTAMAGGELLPPALHDLMWTTVSTDGAGWIPQTRYGSGGVFEQRLPCGVTVYGTGGAVQGGFTYAMASRDGGHTLVTTVNGDWNNPIGALLAITSAEFCRAA